MFDKSLLYFVIQVSYLMTRLANWVTLKRFKLYPIVHDFYLTEN